MIRCGRSQADHPDQFRRTHRNRQQAELEVQMTVVLLAITLVFTLCWVPLQVIDTFRIYSVTVISVDFKII